MLFDNTLNGKLLLQCISIYCNELITSCINQFIPRRFVTPSPIVTNASSPQFESKRPMDMILNESNESPEIICLDSNSNNSSSEEEMTSFRILRYVNKLFIHFLCAVFCS